MAASGLFNLNLAVSIFERTAVESVRARAALVRLENLIYYFQKLIKIHRGFSISSETKHREHTLTHATVKLSLMLHTHQKMTWKKS